MTNYRIELLNKDGGSEALQFIECKYLKVYFIIINLSQQNILNLT